MSDILNTIQSWPHIMIYGKTMHLCISKFTLYKIIVVLIPLQNIFKMFPQISGLENISIVKLRYGDLAILIKDIMFNLHLWLWIIIHCKNLTNILRVIWNIGFTTSPDITTMVNHWANESLITNLLFKILQWFFQLYCQDTFISVVRTYILKTN